MKNIINFVIFSSIFIFGFSFFTPNLSSENKTSKGGNPVVLIKTNKGDIKVELNKDKAPITVENFLIYVNEGFYNGTIFHRVINNFMIQAGGLTQDLQQKPAKSPIKNEANNGLKNVRGSIAMGRTAVVDSATSHFYINHVDNESLDHGKNGFGYAVFGQNQLS
jgi:cyclophilin family peptidyl-prolyl cis-trans isomerase